MKKIQSFSRLFFLLLFINLHSRVKITWKKNIGEDADAS